MDGMTIEDSVKAGQKLSKDEKLKVLRDARELIQDPASWNKGHFQYIEAEGERHSGIQFIPSPGQNASMCVMGALACASGLQGVRDDSDAEQLLITCGLGEVMVATLREMGEGLGDAEIYDSWCESGVWDNDTFESEHWDYLNERPTYEGFKVWLTKHGHKDALAWRMSDGMSLLIDEVYDYNDDSRREHSEVIELLDKAIEFVEKS